MNNTIIAIQPVTIWTPSGTKSVNQFTARYINYQNGPAIADCVLLDSSGNEVSNQLVNATEAQTDAWTTDEDFYKVLAQNAGLSPV